MENEKHVAVSNFLSVDFIFYKIRHRLRVAFYQPFFYLVNKAIYKYQKFIEYRYIFIHTILPMIKSSEINISRLFYKFPITGSNLYM